MCIWRDIILPQWDHRWKSLNTAKKTELYYEVTSSVITLTKCVFIQKETLHLQQNAIQHFTLLSILKNTGKIPFRATEAQESDTYMKGTNKTREFYRACRTRGQERGKRSRTTWRRRNCSPCSWCSHRVGMPFRALQFVRSKMKFPKGHSRIRCSLAWRNMFDTRADSRIQELKATFD